MSPDRNFERVNYRAWEVSRVNPEVASTETILENIIGYATLAPSSHNAQETRYSINPSSREIEVRLAEEHNFPQSDKIRRQAIIGAGAAITHIQFASVYYGYTPEIQILEDPNRLSIAKISLGERSVVKVDDQAAAILDAIPARMVNRSEYEPHFPLPEDTIPDMQQIANVYGVHIDFVTDKASKAAFAAAQEAADRIVLTQQKFLVELGGSLLPNNTNELRGMPGDTFGLTNEVAQRVHQDLLNGTLEGSILDGIPKADAHGIRSSSAIAVISAPKDDKEAWVKSGMAFEHMALYAESQGLNTAVNAALIEGGPIAKMYLKPVLRPKGSPTMIFRLGKATQEKPHSPRIPVNLTVEEAGSREVYEKLKLITWVD